MKTGLMKLKMLSNNGNCQRGTGSRKITTADDKCGKFLWIAFIVSATALIASIAGIFLAFGGTPWQEDSPELDTAGILLLDANNSLSEWGRSRRDVDYEEPSLEGFMVEGSGLAESEETARDKRNDGDDCKPDARLTAIADNLDKVRAEVDKISAHLGTAPGGALASAARIPLCFFSPSAPLPNAGGEGGHVYTGQQVSNGRNPVTCVFITPPAVGHHGGGARADDDGAPSSGHQQFHTNMLPLLIDLPPDNFDLTGLLTDEVVQTSSTSKGFHRPGKRPKTTTASPEAPTSSIGANATDGSARESEHSGPCSAGHVACASGECIKSNLWCDATVDCADASDEAVCGCRRRVDAVRLCDGYLDCPKGEDEIGCHGCAESEFSCTLSGNRDKRHVCLPMNKRCDGHEDCPSGSDEEGCSVLLDGLVNSQQVEMESHTSGYLHVNIKGHWFPLCDPDTDAAVKACKAEVGDDVSPGDIVVEMEPLNSLAHRSIYLTKLEDRGCQHREVAVVRCPQPKCGSRIMDEQPVSRPKTKRVVGGRIVGGKLSKSTAWPFLVAIFRDGNFHCGGSLILEDWVLSAAHCVHDYAKHYYEIQAGMLRRLSFSPHEQTRTVTHVIVHKDYNRQIMTNDLSLLKIAPSVRMSRWARHVCLPPPGVLLPEPSTTCITVGWGATKEHGSDPDQIHEVDVPILDTCKHVEDRRGVEICAGLPEGGKDACQGDSGGPLLCRVPHDPERWYVAGVVSHGEGCARPDEPGAYTRVGIFLDWINYFTTNEAHLPSTRPVGKCPSIECNRVGGQCLSASMVCDKVVDCLHAEDELNCKDHKSRASSNSTARAEEDNPMPPETPSEDMLAKYYTDPKVQNAFQTLKDAGYLKNVTGGTGGLVMPKFFLSNIKTNDTKIVGALDTLKETGLAQEDGLFNVTRLLNSKDGNPNPDVPPSVGEATLDPLNSSTDKPEKKDGVEIDLPPDNPQTNPPPTDAPQTDPLATEQPSQPPSQQPSPPPPSSTTAPPLPETTQASAPSTSSQQPPSPSPPPPSPTQPPESKGGDLDLNQSPTPPPQHPDGIQLNNKNAFFCSHGQTVPLDRRCDSVRDCDDGADEKDCMCSDYLMHVNPYLICNGELDCRDQSDEKGCSICDPDEYLCPISKQCVKQFQICDHQIDCKFYEDESFCFALVKGPEVVLDQANHAVLRREGFLSYRKGNEWFPLCIEKQDISALAAAACANLGFSYYKTVTTELVSKVPFYARSDKDKSTFQYSYDSEMLKEGTPVCRGLYLECGDRLHTKPSGEVPPCGDASWSWFAAIYKEGRYLCGATLINQQWIITSSYCAQKIDLNQHFVGVLLGSHRLPGLESPFEQLRQAVSINEVGDTGAALITLDKPVQLSRQVLPLPLPESYDYPDSFLHCMALGPSSVNGSVIAVQFMQTYCGDNNLICLERICTPPHHECSASEAHRAIVPWAGTIACQGHNGNWYPIAVFDEPLGVCGFKAPIILPRIFSYLGMLHSAMEYPLPPVAAPYCKGLRCPMGKCVPPAHLCDGLADCRDKSDEPHFCDYIKDRYFCLVPENPFTCVCGAHQVSCGDGACVPKHAFCDGHRDCANGADEPKECSSCAAYLRIVDPGKICDGNRNCIDKSDEAWQECGCRPGFYHCFHKGHCIPPSFECDGEPDCPDGEDEKNCVAVRTQRSEVARGDVLKNTCGVWHEYCPEPNANLSAVHVDSAGLCQQMGFSPDAAHMEQRQALAPVPQPIFDMFYMLEVNNNTHVVMRASDRPLVQLKMAPCPTVMVLNCGD